MKSSPEDQVLGTARTRVVFQVWLVDGLLRWGRWTSMEEFSGHFWSTSSIGTTHWTRGLSTGYSGVDRGNNWWARNGLSVRCVRD